MMNHLLVVALIAFLFTFANSENWSVQVGDTGKNVYEPNNFDANVGDTVTFNFVDGTHDVNQADAFASCAKSTAAGAFSAPVSTGNAAAPPTAVWTLGKVGTAFYFCSVADHCSKSLMYAQVNVLDAGAPLKVPGVKAAGAPAAAAPAGPAGPAGPPAQPPAPADDLPNIQPTTPPPPTPTPTTTSSSPSAPASAPASTSTSTSGPAAPAPSNSAARTDKQISVAVVCGALLSLTCYFL